MEALAARPLVSIIMANYNYSGFVGQAIESVLNQTYTHLEIQVCDDGSADDSCSVIEKYVRSDARVHLIRKRNGGMSSAWNAAYAASRGEIVCILDSDDSFSRHKLETIVEKFRKEPSTGFVIHPLMVIDGDSREIQRMPTWSRFEAGMLTESVIRRGGRWRHMPASALCFRREIGAYVFPVPEDIPSMADSFVHILLALLTDVGVVDNILGQYRLHGSNLTGAAVADPKHLRKVTSNVEHITNAVNSRLAEHSLPYTLNVSDNLSYLEVDYQISLLENLPRAELIRRFRYLSGRIKGDDLNTAGQRLLLLSCYGAALLMPASLRSELIRSMGTPSRTKELVRRMLTHLGFLQGTRSTRQLLADGTIQKQERY